MSSLKRRIKAVENSLNVNNKHIRYQQALLRQYVYSKQFLIIGLLGCFFTGYMIARKRTMTQLIRLTLRLALKTEKLYLQIRPVLAVFKIY